MGEIRYARDARRQIHVRLSGGIERISRPRSWSGRTCSHRDRKHGSLCRSETCSRPCPSWQARQEKKLSDEKGRLVFSQYNSRNREPLFVPGGSVMRILVSWKPVVLVWGLLSAMIFFGFVASSVLEGKDPFAPGATITQPSSVKTGAVQSGQQPKRSQKAARTPSQ